MFNSKYINIQSGFIAMFSVIIISFILILISTTLSFSNFSTRFNILDTESKNQSKLLAQACLESARLYLSINNTFSNDIVTINIDNYNCDYSIQNTLPYPTIISHSVINDAHTYFKTLVNKDNISIPIISFEELPTYP